MGARHEDAVFLWGSCTEKCSLTVTQDQLCQRIRQLGPEEDACAYAREFCHGDSQINYTQAYYCHAYPSTALQALLVVRCTD